MRFVTYLQQIWSGLTRSRLLRSPPHYILEQQVELPSLTLREYVDLVSDVALPTQLQKENFVEYVSHAHSWYRNLPLTPPGAPFYFFMDKYAGFDRWLSSDGTAILKERTERGIHRSLYPTAKYRDLFGNLAFTRWPGTKMALMSKGPTPVSHDLAVVGKDAWLYCCPSEVLDAGLTQLTAVIHTRSAFNPLWLDRWPKDPQEIDWPQESGGQLTLEKILSRSEKVLLDPRAMELLRINLPATGQLSSVDAILYELLSPERNRQYGEMMKAINRVCDLISSNKKWC